MKHYQANNTKGKGWFAGPWNCDLNLAVGFANVGVDEPHIHHQVREIYLVAQGTSAIRIEQNTIGLQAGDVLVVDPGEAHTFLSSSPDYYHFVIQTPGLAEQETKSDKVLVSRSRLGL